MSFSAVAARRARRGASTTSSNSPNDMIMHNEENLSKKDLTTTTTSFRPRNLAMVLLVVAAVIGYLSHQQRATKSHYMAANNVRVQLPSVPTANIKSGTAAVSTMDGAQRHKQIQKEEKAEENLDTQQGTTFSAHQLLLPKKALKVPYPIFVASFSKSGTTSTYHAFACYLGHEHVAHRWTTSSDGELVFIGRCIEQNIQHQKPPLEGCGTNRLTNQTQTVVWTDTAYWGRNIGCYNPNIQALDAIWDAYPRATLLLVRRNATAWFHSANSKRAGFIKTWSKACSNNNNTSNRNRNINMPKTANESDWVDFYNSHVKQVRSFAASRQPRGLTYVEVELENPDTGRILEESIGLPRSCWKHCLSSFTQKECKDLQKK